MPPAKKKAAKVAPQPVHASLAHLPPCPECGFRAGAPVMSEGISNEENADCWYETCLNNRPPRYSTCSYFAWRNDIPDGKPANSEARSCPGLLCTSRADAGKNRKTANLDCSFGACKSCCRDIQTTVSPPRWCKVRDHSTGLVRPPMPPVLIRMIFKSPSVVAEDVVLLEHSAKGADEASPHNGGMVMRPANGLVVVRWRHRSGQVPALPVVHLDVATPRLTLLVWWIQICTLIQMRLPLHLTSHGHLWLSQLGRITKRRSQRQSSSSASKLSSQIPRLDTNNDELPQSLVVPVPKWPEFHPPDIPLLADEFLGTNDRFQYWESKDGVWFTGSKGTAPRDLRKLTKDDLCYRSWDVRRGHVQGSDTQPQGPLPALFPSEYTSLASAIARPSSLPLDLSSAPRGQHVWPWRTKILAWQKETSSLRDGLLVETLKVLVPIWTGGKVSGQKSAQASALTDAQASVDWFRISRWHKYSITEPGESPDEDVEMREWLMDRAVYLGILSGKVVVAKHFKGLNLDTGLFSEAGGHDGIFPLDVAPGLTPTARQASGVVVPPADPAALRPQAAAQCSGSAPQPSTSAEQPPPVGPSSSATVHSPVTSLPASVLPPPPTAQPGNPVEQHPVRVDAQSPPMTTGNAEDDRELLAECIKAVGFNTKDDQEPAWSANGLPARKSGKLFAVADVGLYGFDARPDPVHPGGKRIFVIMKSAELRYVPVIQTVVVQGPAVFEALAKDVRFRDVPLVMHGAVMDYAVGIVDTDQESHANSGIYLHTIPQNPDVSSPTLYNVRFGVQFRVDLYTFDDLLSQPQATPTEHTTAISGCRHTGKGSSLRREESPKKKGASVKRENLELDLSQAQWLRQTNDGAWLKDDSVKTLRGSPPRSNYPYKTVLAIAQTIHTLANLGRLPDSAPDPAKGTKIRHTAISRLVGRTPGWVGSAIKLHEQLQAYKGDKEVQTALRRHRDRSVGVKTLLRDIKVAVDGYAIAGAGEEDEDDEDDGSNGGDGTAGEDDDADEGDNADESKRHGKGYGQRIIDEPGQERNEEEGMGAGGTGSSVSTSPGPARKKQRTRRGRKAQLVDPTVPFPDGLDDKVTVEIPCIGVEDESTGASWVDLPTQFEEFRTLPAELWEGFWEETRSSTHYDLMTTHQRAVVKGALDIFVFFAKNHDQAEEAWESFTDQLVMAAIGGHVNLQRALEANVRVEDHADWLLFGLGMWASDRFPDVFPRPQTVDDDEVGEAEAGDDGPGTQPASDTPSEGL
ncbi:hypothetical protein LXA43DRAFT_1069145 [Ganoderma leucocontextum]|nr:hypothetical protein LXA43DRAFT_1069145 [Ganoderma leucocontextum]